MDKLYSQGNNGDRNEAIHVPGAPEVAGLGKLIKDYRLSFTWKWDEYESPLLLDVNGTPLAVGVEADCPILAAVAKSGKTTSEQQKGKTPTSLASSSNLEKPGGQQSQLAGVFLEPETTPTHFQMEEPYPARVLEPCIVILKR